jgi:hypothetical protein
VNSFEGDVRPGPRGISGISLGESCEVNWPISLGALLDTGRPNWLSSETKSLLIPPDDVICCATLVSLTTWVITSILGGRSVGDGESLTVCADLNRSDPVLLLPISVIFSRGMDGTKGLGLFTVCFPGK